MAAAAKPTRGAAIAAQATSTEFSDQQINQSFKELFTGNDDSSVTSKIAIDKLIDIAKKFEEEKARLETVNGKASEDSNRLGNLSAAIFELLNIYISAKKEIHDNISNYCRDVGVLETLSITKESTYESVVGEIEKSNKFKECNMKVTEKVQGFVARQVGNIQNAAVKATVMKWAQAAGMMK